MDSLCTVDVTWHAKPVRIGFRGHTRSCSRTPGSASGIVQVSVPVCHQVQATRLVRGRCIGLTAYLGVFHAVLRKASNRVGLNALLPRLRFAKRRQKLRAQSLPQTLWCPHSQLRREMPPKEIRPGRTGPGRTYWIATSYYLACGLADALLAGAGAGASPCSRAWLEYFFTAARKGSLPSGGATLPPRMSSKGTILP